jgi:proteasome accessory factor A
VLTAPLALVLFAVRWLVAFVPLRRQLTPFLISRTIIAGSGMLDEQGNFLLSDKAPAMNCLTGLGGLLGDRPIYCLGHFFKTVYADAWLAPQQYLRLFARRQRLQISLGDSNVTDAAELLRVGTTLLAIDMIEAGEMPTVFGIVRPLRSLRAICADPSLSARIPLVGGRFASALEIQRFYLSAARRFLDRRPGAPLEAREIIRRWEDALDGLADDPSALIGVLDWVTKRFLLDKAGRGSTWPARKKIDIRYHELSPDGYFQRLRRTGIIQTLLDRRDIDHARRNPPAGTPAAIRGRYIREFATDDEDVSASWQAVFLGTGREARVIRLDRYAAPPPVGSHVRRKSKKGDRPSS